MIIRRVLLSLCCILSPLVASAQLTRQTTINTIAGTGAGGYAAAQDGALASAAQLKSPQGVVQDVLGNLYIADTGNHRVRRIDGKTGVITTIAGNGTPGYRFADENVVATFGELNGPQDLALDSLGNLYIADTGNHRIRKVVLSTGIMTTFAGSGGTTYNQQEQGSPTAMAISQPAGIAVDPYDNLFIADAALNRLFFVCNIPSGALYGARSGQIITLAGNGVAAYTTSAQEENVTPKQAHLANPQSVAVDRFGRIFVADTGNGRIRELAPQSNQGLFINTVAGNGNAYGAASEGGVALSTGIGPVTSIRLDVVSNLFLSLPTANRVLKISALDNKVSTYAGNGTAAFSDNAIPSTAQLNAPFGLAVNGAGTVFIADSANHRLRSIPVASGNLLFAQTPVGSADTSRVLTLTADTALTINSLSVVTASGVAPEYALGTPSGCTSGTALAAGGVCTIPLTFSPAFPGRRMTALQIATSAGIQRFGLSGIGTGPLVVFSPNLPTPLAGSTTGSYTPSEDGGPATAAHLDIDYLNTDAADNLFIGDFRGNRVRRVDAVTNFITTVAGNGSGTAYSTADEGKLATAVNVAGPTAVVVDAAGNLYLNESQNGRIRRVDAVTGKITTYAGTGDTIGAAKEGALATASPANNAPFLTLDQQGNLYLTDTSSNGVRRIDAGTGIINQITKSFANLAAPSALSCPGCSGSPAVSEEGAIYLVGSSIYRINTMTGAYNIVHQQPTPSGSVSLSPTGDLLFRSGLNLMLYGVATDTLTRVASYPASGANAFVLDSKANAIFNSGGTYQLARTSSQSARLNFAGTTVVGQTSTDSPKTLTLGNVGNAAFSLFPPTAGLNPSITSDFQLTSSSTCPQVSATSTTASLAAANACTYGVNFIPVGPGAVQGRGVFTDNQFGAASPVTQSVSLNGTASGTAVTTSIALSGLGNTTAGTVQTVTVTAYSGADQTHVAASYLGTVTFTSSDPNTGVLPAAYTFTAADAGIHTFTITLKKSGSQSVGVTDRSNTTLASGQSVTVQPAVAITATALSGTPQSVNTNAQFGSSLVTVVQDTYGNGVPGVAVTYNFPSTGASATPSSPNGAVTTDSLGQARISATANATQGAYTVTAKAAGITAPASFNITNTPSVFGLTITASGNAFPYGPDVRLTANITPPTVNSTYPTGTVTFYEGATVLASGPVPAGGASPTFLVAAPSVGAHTYSASYSGDATYPAFSQSTNSVSVAVSKGESLITAPFTPSILRPGAFAVTAGNARGADSSTKTYLPPSGAITYTLSAACGNGGALTGSLPLTNGATSFNVPSDCRAGSYEIAYGYAGDANYNPPTFNQHSSLTVTAPAATVTITNLDQQYDGSPKPVTVTTSPAGLAYSISYTGSNAGAPTLAGVYPVRVVITDPNYTGSATATLTVHKGPVAISWPLLDPIQYGTPLSTTQLSATTTAPGAFLYNPLAGTILTPGVYTLNVTFTPTDSPSTPTSATQTLTVTKAPLIVKAVDAGRVYAAADPAFTTTITGAVNGDTFTTGGTTTATSTSPVGTYPITPTIAGANLAFYNVTPVNGILTISGTPATITLGNLNQVYDGTVKSVTVTTAPTGLATTLTYNGNASAPSAPGSYAVVATISDPNYTGTANGVLTITAGTAAVTWNTPAPITYGTALSPAQLNATSIAAGTFAYTPAAGTVLLPGSQTLTVVFTPSAPGANPTTATVVLLVNKAALTVTAANASRRFGVANPPLTAVVTGAVNGDVLTASATTAATPASPIGNYPILPTVSGTNFAAYNVTLVNGVLSVTPGQSSVALVSSAPTTFVGDNVTFTATVAGPGATPTGTVEFFNGTSSLGVKTLSLTGSASVSTSTLTAGTYNLTATYSGDAVYAPSTSPVLLETIFTSDYTIVVNPTVLTIKRGQTGTAVFTVTPTGNFHDTITFACATLPVHTTCTFAPPTLTPNGAPVSTTLTIDTGAKLASLEHLAPWSHSTSGIAFAVLAGFLFTLRRRRGLPNLLLLLLVAAVATIGISGCGSSTSANTAPAGNYSVSINAGAGTGSASHPVSLTVNIIE